MTVPQTADRWRKSTYSSTSGGTCVEVKNTLGAVRDSKNVAGPVLAVPMLSLVAAVKTGQITR